MHPGWEQTTQWSERSCLALRLNVGRIQAWTMVQAGPVVLGYESVAWDLSATGLLDGRTLPVMFTALRCLVHDCDTGSPVKHRGSVSQRSHEAKLPATTHQEREQPQQSSKQIKQQ